jgi:hypothetical protein
MVNPHLDNGVPWSPSAPSVPVVSNNRPPNIGSALPGGSNITGTTSGTANPHTDTGFSGGSTLPTGAPNPGYTPPPPGGGGNGDDGAGTGGGGNGGSGLPGGGTDTGSGSSGGSGAAGSGMSGTELAALANAITGSNILGGGEDNLRKTSRNTFSLIDPTFQEGWENLEAKPVDTTINTDLLHPTIQENDRTQLLGGDNETGWQYNVKKPNEISYDFENLGSLSGNVSPDGFGINYSIPTNQLFNIFKAQGGPVGLMSLPQGYAAGGEVDPSDWRVIQQIIAAGGNPEDYVSYENGGEVIEGTDTMEELTPFGGTRERVIDQVEAFDNAPHHIEEPMIGMYGEKIPLTTARRVQKYMEGMDPVKRGLIEEMMQMFSMKNMMRKHQEQQETGQFFGPQPKEYDI